jgi:hypothetical protein
LRLFKEDIMLITNLLQEGESTHSHSEKFEECAAAMMDDVAEQDNLLQESPGGTF